MKGSEIVTVLRSNCARLVQIVDNQEMQRIYNVTDEAIEDINILTKPECPRKQVVQNNKMSFTWQIGTIAKCPHCGRILPTAQYPHCPYCGQIIDWSKEDV